MKKSTISRENRKLFELGRSIARTVRQVPSSSQKGS